MKQFCTKTIPVLRIFDIDKAKEFYLDWLGFEVDWEHQFFENAPIYMQISRGGLTLHLSEHHGDCCPGAKIFIHTEAIEAIHQDLMEKNYKYNCPEIETVPWNAHCLEVTDPFGNRLSFNQYHAS
jgi:uncharacterized glyoxalase superfamily protein PhnB